jgi:hypothetical protein
VKTSNLAIDDLLADPNNVLDKCNYYFSLLLNVHNVSKVRQKEIHIAEPLVPGASPFEAEITITVFKCLNYQVETKFWQNRFR